MQRPRAGTILRAVGIAVLAVLPTLAFANNPVVTKELKHDVSGPLRNVVVSAQTGGGQQLSVAQPTRDPLSIPNLILSHKLRPKRP